MALISTLTLLYMACGLVVGYGLSFLSKSQKVTINITNTVPALEEEEKCAEKIETKK